MTLQGPCVLKTTGVQNVHIPEPRKYQRKPTYTCSLLLQVSWGCCSHQSSSNIVPDRLLRAHRRTFHIYQFYLYQAEEVKSENAYYALCDTTLY